MALFRRNVKSVAESGGTQVRGNVTLSEGTGITITQSSQDLQIATTGTASAPTAPSAAAGTATTTGTPGTPTLAVGSATQTSLTVTWTDVSNEQYYSLQRNTANSFPSQVSPAPIASPGQNSISYVSDGLSANTLYYYQLHGVNDRFNVALTWTDNSTNEDGFEIQRALASNYSDATTIYTSGPNVAAYTDTNLQITAANIYYRVRAINSAGSSSYSNATVAVTTPTRGSSSVTASGTTSAASGTQPLAFVLVNSITTASTSTTSSLGNSMASSYINFGSFNSGGAYGKVRLIGKFRQRLSGGTAQFQLEISGIAVTNMAFTNITSTTVSPNWESKIVGPQAYTLPTSGNAYVRLKGRNTTSGKYAEATDVTVYFEAA